MFVGINVRKNSIRMITFALLILSFVLSGCIQKVVRLEGGGWDLISDDGSNHTGSNNQGNNYNNSSNFNNGAGQNYNNDHLPTGKPYVVWGETYVPYTSAYGFKEEGIASWYGPGFHGKLTANGEKYNQNAMTAAHKQLPFGTEVRVLNLDTGKSVNVRINDRGPFKDGRVIDLSKEAAKRVGMLDAGTARVRIEAINVSRSENDGVSGGVEGAYSATNSNNGTGDSFTSTNLTDFTDLNDVGIISDNLTDSSFYGDSLNGDSLISDALASVESGSALNSLVNTGNTFNQASTVYSFYLQVGAFEVRNNADFLHDNIEKSGYATRVSSDGNINYVQVGPYASEALAREVMKKFEPDFPRMMLVVE